MQSKKPLKVLERIAKEVLFMDTLEERRSDHLDFFNVSVWGVREALERAYEEGKKAERRNQKQRRA